MVRRDHSIRVYITRREKSVQDIIDIDLAKWFNPLLIFTGMPSTRALGKRFDKIDDRIAILYLRFITLILHI